LRRLKKLELLESLVDEPHFCKDDEWSKLPKDELPSKLSARFTQVAFSISVTVVEGLFKIPQVGDLRDDPFIQ